MKFHLFTLASVLTVLALWLTPAPAHAFWLHYSDIYSGASYGFWSGLWHGLTAPFAFIAELFNDDIVLYSSDNSGFTYNLGFLIGISAIIGGGASGASRDRS